jgi:polysaccharide export outer membrane protein
MATPFHWLSWVFVSGLLSAQEVSTRIAPTNTDQAIASVARPDRTDVPLDSLAGAAQMESLDTRERIGLGDRLSFRIVEDQEDAKPLLVTDSGEIELPYLGRFLARDKTCRQLAFELKHELEKDYYYQATVMIAVDLRNKSRGRVYVVGAVRLPGPQEIPADQTYTTSKAIMRAGGFADFADKRRVKLTRTVRSIHGQHQVQIVNVEDILERDKVEADVRLLPEDLVYVPSRLLSF